MLAVLCPFQCRVTRQDYASCSAASVASLEFVDFVEIFLNSVADFIVVFCNGFEPSLYVLQA